MSQSSQSRSGRGQVLASANSRFNGVKVFSATMVAEREQLGDKISEWLRANPHIEPRDAVVTQSSDEAFHCLAITIFYWERPA